VPNFGSKFGSKPAQLRIVILYRTVELRLGLSQKANCHGFKYFARTSFASRAIVSPCR
jgi:hypothetical protein